MNDEIKNRDDLKYYNEKHRPQIHFSPEENWMNDPNGLVYYNGEYHLFYQYHPHSSVWGPMHWGHAVSEDLLHWEHLPIALKPDEYVGMAYSGSAVIDWEDTSGFFDGEDGIVLIYTSTLGEEKGGHQQQSIAYSKDNGRSWIKYKDNPVISNKDKADFRDPKVFWHKKTQKWIMVLVSGDRVEFYSSKNLKEWEYLSEFGEERGAHEGVWECPDLFPLNYCQRNDENIWTLKVDVQKGALAGGSGGQYFIGHFDGERFIEIKNHKEVNWLDHGRDFYAAQSWNDLPDDDGRIIWLGWMSNWDYANQIPTEKWRSAMSIPREVEVKKEQKEYTIIQKPIEELKALREEKIVQKNLNIPASQSVKFDNLTNPLEINIEIDLTTDSNFEIAFNFSNNDLKLEYDRAERLLRLDRTNSSDDFHPAFLDRFDVKIRENKKLDLQIFLDWSSIEIFINNGEHVITSLCFPEEVNPVLKITSMINNLFIRDFRIYSLKSIW